jgi:hypothetical protein
MSTWKTPNEIANDALWAEIMRLLRILPQKQQDFFWKLYNSQPSDKYKAAVLPDLLRLTQRSIDKYCKEAP